MADQLLKWDKVALIGFGSQGKAWAANLRDSGITVDVFLRQSSSLKNSVIERGFQLVQDLSEYACILLLIPDDQHHLFLSQLASQMRPGTSIIYAHGASMMEGKLNIAYPQFNHLLLAPKAIASEVRFQYENKGKLGAVYSIKPCANGQSQESENKLLQLAQDLGITSGPHQCTFEQEAAADLFSEQSLLCGLLPHAAKASFDLLVSKGIPVELAFMECWLEVKLIADAMVKKGPEGFFELISPHALKGSHLAKDRFFDKVYHEKLEVLFSEIYDGTFFKKAEEVDLSEVKGIYQKTWGNSDLQQAHEKLKSNLVPD